MLDVDKMDTQVIEPLVDLPQLRTEAFRRVNEETYLIGTRSKSTGQVAYPGIRFAYGNCREDCEASMIGPRGTLYSFTRLGPLKDHPTPTVLGYVDFSGDVRVFARIRGVCKYSELRCDLPVMLNSDDSDWWVEPITGD